MILVENLTVPFDRRVWQEARALQSHGYHVHVVAPSSPEHPSRHEVRDDITIHRYHPVHEGESLFGYLLEYGVALVSMAGIVAKIARRQRIDVIQACNPPDLLFLVAAPFVVLGTARFIFDHHDACPELMEAKGRAAGSISVRTTRVLERMTFRLASTTIAPNETYRELAIRRGHKRPADVFVVRSGPAIGAFEHAPASRRLHFGHDYLVAYVGVMGMQDSIDYLIDAAYHVVHVLERTDIHFTLAGSGTEFKRLAERIGALGLHGHVRLLGRVSDEEFGELLGSADVCVGPDEYSRLNDMSTMNKIVEYMAFSKPIVQFDLSEGRVSAGDASLYVERNNAAALARGITELLDDEPRRKRMGEISRERLEGGLAWEYQIPPLLSAYEAALAKPRRRWDRRVPRVH